MLSYIDVNKQVCENSYRVIAYRRGHLVYNAGFGVDGAAAKTKYDELRQQKDFWQLDTVVLFNFNQPLMVAH